MWPLVAMAAVGAALLLFVLFGRTGQVPIEFGYFEKPPIYGDWKPTISPLALYAVGAGLLLAAFAWWFTSSTRIPTGLGLGVLVVLGVATAAGLAVVRGQWTDLFMGISTGPTGAFYSADLHYICEYGVRGFAQEHPSLTSEFLSYNTRTHPPGFPMLLFGLFWLIGDSHPLRITTVMAAIGMSAALGSYVVGRVQGGGRSGRIAAVLLVAAPGPLLLAYTVPDALFATALVTSAALFMLSIHRRSMVVAAAAGAVLGLSTLLTYASSFILAAAALAVVIQTRRLWDSVRLLGSAAVGGLLVLALGRVGLGIDVWASYQASPNSGRAYDPYWIFGHQAAWLLWAGLPIATLGVVGLFRRSPRAALAVLPLAVVAVMVVWGVLPSEVIDLRPGEVERTWAFLYPLLAGTAGPVVDRWTRERGGWRGGVVVAGLVLLSVAQAILLQALWENEVGKPERVFDLDCLP